MDHADDKTQDTEAQRQADERLIHALLVHLHDQQTAQHRQQQVQRVMEVVRREAKTVLAGQPAVTSGYGFHSTRWRSWISRGAWAAAASVLVGIGVWFFTYSPASAMGALNDMISALGRPGDRTYHIGMEDLPEPPGRKPPEENWPAQMPRPGLDDAKLYLRDSQQYLLVRHDPNGGLIFDGYDGQQSWRVRRGELAEKKEGLGAGRIPMPPLMADVPFCDLQQALERIRVDYAPEQSDQASLSPGGQQLRHVRVRRHSREVKGPETIDIWADPHTGMPRRIVFDRAKLQGNRQPCRLTFDLVGAESLPTDWFGYVIHVTKPSEDERDGPGRP